MMHSVIHIVVNSAVHSIGQVPAQNVVCVVAPGVAHFCGAQCSVHVVVVVHGVMDNAVHCVWCTV